MRLESDTIHKSKVKTQKAGAWLLLHGGLQSVSTVLVHSDTNSYKRSLPRLLPAPTEAARPSLRLSVRFIITYIYQNNKKEHLLLSLRLLKVKSTRKPGVELKRNDF